MNKEEVTLVDKNEVQKFDALWWITIFLPVAWWIISLVLVIFSVMDWGGFLVAGFIVQGVMYALHAVFRMLIKSMGRGYAKAHHIAFLVAGIFMIILGIIMIFAWPG